MNGFRYLTDNHWSSESNSYGINKKPKLVPVMGRYADGGIDETKLIEAEITDLDSRLINCKMFKGKISIEKELIKYRIHPKIITINDMDPLLYACAMVMMRGNNNGFKGRSGLLNQLIIFSGTKVNFNCLN